MGHGLYIHIPFCRKKCPYCDFYSIEYNPQLVKDYINILSKQIEKINTQINTIYIGGGTPTVLEYTFLKRLLNKLSKFLRASYENTIEANPESVNKDKIKLLLKHNVNRLSIGVQSVNDKKLRFLGRIHNASQAFRAVEEAKEGGFSNISVDLIYGIPKESLTGWKGELREVIKLPINHISCYSLSCEPKTKFYKLKNKISEEEVANMYLFNIRFLPRKGFFHYEVSNFSKKDFECLHNLSYWRGNNYIGLGASAVSFVNGKRIKNIASVEEYIKRVHDKKDYWVHEERLIPLKRARELAALKIRTKEGINFKEFKKMAGFDFFKIIHIQTIEQLGIKGFLRLYKRKGKLYKISLTEKGFLFCDEVSSEFI